MAGKKKTKPKKTGHKAKRPTLSHLSWILLVIVAALAYFFVTNIARAEQEENRGLLKGNVSGRAKDRILVQFKSGISESHQKEILGRENLTEKETLRGTKIKVVTVPAGKDPALIAANLRNTASSSLVFAETDDIVTPEFIPNDPRYPSQWHLPMIRAPRAWDHTANNTVLLAICDTGVEANHEDLAPVLRADLGYNTVDNSTNWSPVHYHGTMVAGTAAAAVNNALGVAGVARNAMIIPVRISNFSDGGAYVSDAVECIGYAAEKGAKSVNLSYRMAGYAAIDSAAASGETGGMTTVVAAGNDGIDPAWTDFPTFLAVGATSANDTHTSWSNIGAYIDIVAPGESIHTTYPGNGYASASGTSFSSPIVTGAIALLAAHKPDITPDEVRTILYTSADDLGTAGDDNVYGRGRLNAGRAVEILLGIDPPTPTPTAPDTTPPTVSITYPYNRARLTPQYPITITAQASDNIGVKNVEFRVSKVDKQGKNITLTTVHICPDFSAPYSCAWTVPPDRGVTYRFQAQAWDVAGNTGESRSVDATVR